MKKIAILFAMTLLAAAPALAETINTSTADVPEATVENISAAASTAVSPPLKAEIIDVRPVSTADGTGSEYFLVLKSGQDAGSRITIIETPDTLSIGAAKYFSKGDDVVVEKIDKIDGSSEYVISDYQRGGPLTWLAVFFVAVVIWISRWRGLRSLVGLSVSFLIIIMWIVPQIANGGNPVLITIIGSAAIITLSLVVTEGFRRMTLATLLGLLLTMAIIGLLSRWSISFTHLSGVSNEEAFYLYSQTGDTINLQGLLLAGFIIGTLGILTDVGVGQVATVAELRAVNPAMSSWTLYRSAMRVGQSHLAAIVHTLILAYAGTALPLLVLLNSSGVPAGSVVSGELVATEIVRSIVGSIGLVLALPITTWIAVWLNVTSPHGLAEHQHKHHSETH